MASIPFEIPAKFLADVSTGSIERYGAILKDINTGEIVGHLQETGGLYQTISQGTGGAFQVVNAASNPLGGITSVAGAIDSAYQNRKMVAKLDQLQGMVGGLQSLAMVNLATSVIGIGVTVASTQIILSRMSAIYDQLGRIESKLDHLPKAIEEMHLRSQIVDVQTSFERFGELKTRKEKGSVLANLEEKLHRAHDQFTAALDRMKSQSQGNSDLVLTLLQGVLLSSSIGSRSLMAADELETARDRAQRQSQRFRQIVWDWPDDLICERLSVGDEERTQISEVLNAGMEQQSSQPLLFENLLKRGLKGSDYLHAAEEEQTEPVLLLPATEKLA